MKMNHILALAMAASVAACDQTPSGSSQQDSGNRAGVDSSGRQTYPLPGDISQTPKTIAEKDQCVQAAIKEDYRFSSNVTFRYSKGSMAAYGTRANPDGTTELTTLTLIDKGIDPLALRHVYSTSRIYGKDQKITATDPWIQVAINAQNLRTADAVAGCYPHSNSPDTYLDLSRVPAQPELDWQDNKSSYTSDGYLVVYSRQEEAVGQQQCGITRQFVDINGDGKHVVPATSVIADPKDDPAGDPSADPLADIRNNGAKDGIIVARTNGRSILIMQPRQASRAGCG